MNRSHAVRWQMSSLRTKLSVVNFTFIDAGYWNNPDYFGLTGN